MRRSGATTSWGVRLLLSAALPLLPQALPPQAPPTRNAPPAPPPAPVPTPYDQAWIQTLELDHPLQVMTTTHEVILMGPTRVIARGLDDGLELWHLDFPTVTALDVNDTRVLVGADGALRALDPKTGKSLWTVEGLGALDHVVNRDGWVLASAGGTLGAFRATDGSVIWQETFGPDVVGAPGLDGDSVFVLLADGRLLRLAVESGEVVWSTPLDAAAPGLLAANDLVYLSLSDGGFDAYQQKDGHFAWRYKLRGPIIGEALSDTAHVYVSVQDNTIQALDRYVGNQRWQSQLTGRPPTGPLLTPTDVLLPSENGEIAMARRTNGRLEGHIPSPAVPAGQSGTPRLLGLATATGDVILRLVANPDTTISLAAFHRTPKPPKKGKAP